MIVNNYYLNFKVQNLKTNTPNRKDKHFQKISNYYHLENTVSNRITFKGVAEMKFPNCILAKMPEISLEKLYTIAQNPQNMLGVGANSKVFNIPGLDDYVVKILNKDDPNKIPLNIFPDNVNLGQPVWQSNINPRVLILKKIKGVEYSIPNWNKTIFNPETYRGNPISKDQTAIYIEKLSKISQMNQTAYDEFLKKVKLLDNNDFKVDSINPNNLIVDYDNNKINIIDYFKVKKEEKHLYQNSALDIVAIIADFTLFPEYYDKMNNKEKESALNAIATVYKKAGEAAKKAGLSCDKEVFQTFIRETSQWFPTKSVKKDNGDGMYFRYYDVRLDDFLAMLENFQKWAQEHNM